MHYHSPARHWNRILFRNSIPEKAVKAGESKRFSLARKSMQYAICIVDSSVQCQLLLRIS